MINYKHLYYFYVVAQKGSITQACETLHLTPQTISGQLSQLEERLGLELFSKVGRGLKLTASGNKVLEYAAQIFAIGGELEDMLRSLPHENTIDFKVGVLDVIPKSIAYQLLCPAFDINKAMRISCKEGNIEELLLDLAAHKLDLVLADTTIPKNLNIKGFSHALGSSGISFFAAQDLAKKIAGDFPACLNNAPLLIPSKASLIHEKILNWLELNNIKANIIGEFDDTALMKAFGRGGLGAFAAPTTIAKEVEHEYDVIELGKTEDISESFYAITVERKIIHPAVISITDKAKKILN